MQPPQKRFSFLIAWLCMLIANAQPNPPPITPNKKLTVCTLDRPPMSFCNSSIPSTEYAGLTIEAFRDAASEIGWQEGEEYDFKCLTTTTTDMMKILATDDGTCDVAAAATTISVERQVMGVQFAYPYYSSRVSIMVESKPAKASGWAWIEPFSAELWIAIVVTMLVWPVLVFLIEFFSMKPRLRRREFLHGVNESTWLSLWCLQHGNNIEVASLGARIAVTCFAFFALIISSSYTASLAAFLTIQAGSTINNVYDLNGLAVSSVPAYIPALKSQYGIIASDANVTSIADVEEEADYIVRGNVKGFFYDEPQSRYVVAQYPDCGVRLLKDTVQTFDFGIGFAPSIDTAIVNQFSTAILKLQEGGTINELERRFMLLNSPCLVENSGGIENESISFQSVYGLWIILAAGLIIGALFMLLSRYMQRKLWRLQLEEEIQKLEAEQQKQKGLLPADGRLVTNKEGQVPNSHEVNITNDDLSPKDGKRLGALERLKIALSYDYGKSRFASNKNNKLDHEASDLVAKNRETDS